MPFSWLLIFFGRQADKRTDGQTNLPIEAHIWLKIVFMDGNPFEAYQKSKIMWKLLPVLKLNSLVDSGKTRSKFDHSSRQSTWYIFILHFRTSFRTTEVDYRLAAAIAPRAKTPKITCLPERVIARGAIAAARL